MPAPTTETATALLTAESLIIAVISVAASRFDVLNHSASIKVVKRSGYYIYFLIVIAFVSTLVLIYAHHYPGTWEQHLLSPKRMLALSLISLLLAGLTSLGVLAWFLVQTPPKPAEKGAE
jgi:hypothetical protein